MLLLVEMCFEGMGPFERGFDMLMPGEMCFEGMGAVSKGV